MDLRINTEQLSQGQALLSLEGQLDASAGAELISRLEDLIHSNMNQFIVDMANLSAVDSSGLAALVTCLKQARKAGGAFALAGLTEPIEKIFKQTMLEQVFTIYPEAMVAIDTLSNGPTSSHQQTHGQPHDGDEWVGETIRSYRSSGEMMQSTRENIDTFHPKTYMSQTIDKTATAHRDDASPFLPMALSHRGKDQLNTSKSATVSEHRGRWQWWALVGLLLVAMIIFAGRWRGGRLETGALPWPILSAAPLSAPTLSFPAPAASATVVQAVTPAQTTMNSARQDRDTAQSIGLIRTIKPVVVPSIAPVTVPVILTVPMTLTVEAQQRPVASATSRPSPTFTPSPTTMPTVSATVSATVTPSPTNRPQTILISARRKAAPVVTPTATAATPAATPADGLTNAQVELLEPAERDTLEQKRPFRWQANFTPPSGLAFEVVFWQHGQDPLLHGKGYAGLTTDHQINVSAENFRLRNAPAGEYRWGVLLVIQQPYQRVKYLGGDRVIYVR